MTPVWESVRAQFPPLERWTFLNTATFGQLPKQAVEAVARHFARRDREACRDFLEWFDDADRIRGKLARLIHASPEDIAFVPNAATGLGILMSGLGRKPGDRVVTLRGEFPNQLYITALARQRGLEGLEADWESLESVLNDGARLLLVSTVNYVTGFRPPLEKLSELCRTHGVLLCLDGTQSVGALAFDAARIRPAALVVDAYKWLLGPTGSGFLYMDPELRAQLRPTIVGWRSDRRWRQVDNLHHGVPEFPQAAERFEGGMLPFPALYGMEASVDLMLELGPERIEQRVNELAEAARAVLRRAGGELLSDEAPHYDSPIIAAKFPGRDPAGLVRELYARGILVSARHGWLRVSVHFYNNEADLERLEAALGELLRR